MTVTATSQSVEPKLNRKLQSSRLAEATVWQPLQNGWRQLYGGFYDLGVSIEWHGFELSNPFEWSRSFHPDSLELCLNLAGCGSIRCSDGVLTFEPLTAGFYLMPDADSRRVSRMWCGWHACRQRNYLTRKREAKSPHLDWRFSRDSGSAGTAFKHGSEPSGC